MAGQSSAARTRERVNITGSYDDRIAEAHWHAGEGDLPKAIEILERIVARISRLAETRRPTGSPLHGYLVEAADLVAEIHFDQGDMEQADALWRHLEDWDADDAAKWQLIPFQRRALAGDAQAFLDLQDRLADEPDDFLSWIAFASIALRTNRSVPAEFALRHCYDLLQEDSNDAEWGAYSLLTYQFLFKMERWQEAAEAWLDVVEFMPEFSGGSEAVVRDFLSRDQFDLALFLLDDGLLDEIPTLHYRAWIARRRGDMVRARHLWNQIVNDPDASDPGVILITAMALCWLDQPTQAISFLLESGPTNLSDSITSSHTILALAWAMRGNVPTARADLIMAQAANTNGEPLSMLEWDDFEVLVKDKAVKAALREFFEPD